MGCAGAGRVPVSVPEKCQPTAGTGLVRGMRLPGDRGDFGAGRVHARPADRLAQEGVLAGVLGGEKGGDQGPEPG